MKASFKLCKVNPHSLIVYGKEVDNETFDIETSVANNTFTHMDTISLNYVVTVNSSDEETFYQANFIEHTQVSSYDVDDTETIDIQQDGLHKVTRFQIPLLKGCDEENLGKFKTAQLTESDPCYVYYTGEDGKIEDTPVYQNTLLKLEYIDETFIVESITVQELYEASQDEETEQSKYLTYHTTYTFLIFLLLECYFKIASELLNKLCPSGSCTTYQQLTSKRDIVWMALNIIKYLIELEQYYEAQRYLEILENCGGICSNLSNEKGGGCGCSS